MNIWNLIKEDLAQPARQDPAFRSKFEILFNYPGVWAIVNYRLAHYLWEKDFKRLSRMIAGISTLITRVDLHPAAKLGRRVFIDHATGIVIGETTEVGDDCLIYQGVTLGGVSLNKGKRHPTLENGVVVGAGAKILGNITIGQNAKIGANSVVVKNVEANTTAVGIPAKNVNIRSKNQHDHDKIPDVQKEIFNYLIKRIENLESTIIHSNLDDGLIEKDLCLDEKFEKFIKSVKE